MPTPAAPGRLCLGDQHQPFGGTILSAGSQSSIRAGQTVDDLDLQGSGRFRGQQRRDGGGIEHVGSRGEDVAAVGHRRHRDAVGPQGRDGFPDSRAAHAQLLRQLLPGNVFAPGSIQRGQHVRFYHGTALLSAQLSPSIARSMIKCQRSMRKEVNNRQNKGPAGQNPQGKNAY